MNRRTQSHHQGGFTLIEVLIALLVLSVGLLGIAALQGASMRGTQSAYFRSQATTLGYQIVDAMRANREGARQGHYNDSDGTANHDCTSDASVATCDLAIWEDALAQRLPSAEGTVSVSAANIATVCIRWTPTEERDHIASTSDSCANPAQGVRLLELETEL